MVKGPVSSISTLSTVHIYAGITISMTTAQEYLSCIDTHTHTHTEHSTAALSDSSVDTSCLIMKRVSV